MTWKRKRPRRTKPYAKKQFIVWFDKRTPSPMVDCPRCRRRVEDTDQGRRGHRVSCVAIPEKRPSGWGVKLPKKEQI